MRRSPAMASGLPFIFSALPADDLYRHPACFLIQGTTNNQDGAAMSEKAQHGLVDVSDARHGVVHSEAYAYCAHPHIVVAPDGAWVVVFNRAPRRPFVLHPPEEPLY